MKMMHGAFFFPCSNRSRTREAPTPTNISTKSEPEIVKNGTFASPATARARRVLPVAGRRRVVPADLVAPDGHLLDVSLADLVQEPREADLLDGGRAGLEDVPGEDDQDENDHPEKKIFDGCVQRHSLGREVGSRAGL